jgi:hypothetical protein
MPRLLSTIIIFCISITGLSAQAIYELTDTASYTFRYIPYQRTVNNKVLNQLALAHLKIPEKASITYTFRYRVSINYSQNDSLFVLFDVRTLKVEGDNNIRDFNIQQLLQPSVYDVSFSVESAESGIILDRRVHVELDNGIAALASFPDSLWGEGISVNLQFNEIRFSDHDFRKLELELSAIRDYYASSSLADTLLGRIQKARKNTASLNHAANIYITGLKGLYLLDQSFNISSEIVPGHDPLKIAARTKILKYNFKEYVDFTRQSGRGLLRGNPYLTLGNAYIGSAIDANKLSQKVDYYNSPFYYKLFSNSVTASQFAEAGRLLRAEANKRKLEEPDFRLLTRNILRGYITQSEQLLKESRYLEAVDFLSGARKFRDLTPYGQLSSEIDNRLALARNGLILSYTDIIQKSLDKNLYSLAENYLAEVERFIGRYNLENDASGPFRELYIRMSQIHVKFGSNALDKLDYNLALAEFSKALEFLNGYETSIRSNAENGQLIAVRALHNQQLEKVNQYLEANDQEMAEAELITATQFAEAYPGYYPDQSVSENLRYRIAYMQYNSLMASLPVNELTTNVNHIKKLIEAKDLIYKYHLPEYERLDTVILNIGMPWLNNQFSRGRLKYWASETDSALFYAGNAYNYATRLGLERQPSIDDQYNKLIALAGETFCNKVKGEFNSLMNQAEQLFRENKFNDGIAVTGKARELVYSKATCGLVTLPINKLLDKYEHSLKWNKLVNEAFVLLNEKSYRESADLIQQAESVYSFYHLDTIGIARIGYYELALKSDDRDLLRHATGFLISRSEPDKAMALLDRLRQTGCSASEAGDLQESVARNLGIRDIAETPDLNIKVMLESYTKADKWYLKFENVYRYYTKAAEPPLINRTIEKISGEIKDIF